MRHQVKKLRYKYISNLFAVQVHTFAQFCNNKQLSQKSSTGYLQWHFALKAIICMV